MPELTHRDTRVLLDSINILNSDISWETLPDRTLRAALALIPNSTMTSFDGLGANGEYINLWSSPPGALTPELLEVMGKLIHEHPYYQSVVQTREYNVIKISDFVPLSKFQRSELFNEVYWTFDGETEMSGAMRISPECVLACSFSRPKSDFTESEREVLRLLTPHIKAAFQNAREFENLSKAKNGLSKVAKKGVAIIDANYGIVFISELAVRLLEKYFGPVTNDVLPDELFRFVREQNLRSNSEEYFEPAEMFRVRQEDSELQIQLAFDFAAGELTLFMEEKLGFSRNDLLPLGLTKRETEILFWLCRGKTYAVIGQLCGISTRTVQKHVEHIFGKLDVETRSGAVAAAYERTRL